MLVIFVLEQTACSFCSMIPLHGVANKPVSKQRIISPNSTIAVKAYCHFGKVKSLAKLLYFKRS